MYQILIIDDEAAARATLRDYIESSNLPFEIIGEACDGTAGLYLTKKLKPDLLFLDICMPDMDGLSLLRRLRDSNFNCKVVMLTAYSNFDYARLSVELHAFDYMLKPIRQDGLQRLLEKVASALEEERQLGDAQEKLKLTAERNWEAYQNTVLSRFLKKDSNQKILQDAYKILPARSPFLIAAYSLKKGCGGPAFLDWLQSAFDQNSGPFFKVFAVETADEMFASIHFLPDFSSKEASSPELIDPYFQWLSQHMQSQNGADPILGLSSLSVSIGQAPDAYAQAVAAIFSQFSLPSQPVIGYDQCRTLVNTCDYPQELEGKILFSMLHGNRGNALFLMNEFFDRLLSLDLNTALLKQMCMHLGLAVLKKGKSSPQFLTPALEEEPLFFDISRYRTVYDFKLFLERQICRFADQAEQAKRSVSNQKFIEDVRAYLSENLSNDIGLMEISSHFGVTPGYFSTLFKREFHENFVEYVTRQKLVYANQLLMDPKISITEIARQLGYHDARYFFKVYKKYEGISPGEYRKQAGTRLSKEPDPDEAL